jgi:DNA repair protein SbcC/Rad50
LNENVAQLSYEELELKQASVQISDLDVDLMIIETEIEAIQKLKTFLHKNDPSLKLNEISCKEGLAAFDDIKIKNDTHEQQLKQLKTIKNHMDQKGFTEDEYQQLIAKLPQEILSLSSIEERLSYTTKTLNNSMDAVESLAKQRKEWEATIEKASNDISLLSRQFVNYEPSAQEFYLLLKRKTNNLRTAISKIENVKEFITIEDNTDILKLQIALQTIQEIISTYLNQRHQLRVTTDNFKLLTARIESDNKLKLNCEKKYSQCKKAIVCLTEILEADSKEKAMQEFANIYWNSILSIFKRIQSPREFDDINFGDSAQKLTGTSFALRRKSDGKWANISEVSTGQRSALALAIFLALNQSAETAPPLLLLDDPIAHADDLNILSFFDYLRVLVVQGSRQVIFATADEKVAYLFKSKFSFLGEDLVVHEV